MLATERSMRIVQTNDMHSFPSIWNEILSSFGTSSQGAHIDTTTHVWRWLTKKRTTQCKLWNSKQNHYTCLILALWQRSLVIHWKPVYGSYSFMHPLLLSGAMVYGCARNIYRCLILICRRELFRWAIAAALPFLCCGLQFKRATIENGPGHRTYKCFIRKKKKKIEEN